MTPVFPSVAHSTALAAAFEAREACTTARQSATCATYNTPNYREKNQTDDDDSSYDGPFAIVFCHTIVPARKCMLNT